MSNVSSNSNFLFLGTGGGVLFPPNFSLGTFNNPLLFMNYAKFADDIWLNAVIKFFNYKICRLNYQPSLLQVFKFNSHNLSNYNYLNDGNDLQISAVRNYFIENFNFDPF